MGKMLAAISVQRHMEAGRLASSKSNPDGPKSNFLTACEVCAVCVQKSRGDRSKEIYQGECCLGGGHILVNLEQRGVAKPKAQTSNF